MSSTRVRAVAPHTVSPARENHTGNRRGETGAPGRPGTDHHSSWNTPSAANSLRATSRSARPRRGWPATAAGRRHGGHHRRHQRPRGDGGPGGQLADDGHGGRVERPPPRRPRARAASTTDSPGSDTPTGEGHLARCGAELVGAHGRAPPAPPPLRRELTSTAAGRLSGTGDRQGHCFLLRRVGAERARRPVPSHLVSEGLRRLGAGKPMGPANRADCVGGRGWAGGHLVGVPAWWRRGRRQPRRGRQEAAWAGPWGQRLTSACESPSPAFSSLGNSLLPPSADRRWPGIGRRSVRRPYSGKQETTRGSSISLRPSGMAIDRRVPIAGGWVEGEIPRKANT